MSLNPIARRRERCREALELLSDYVDGELGPVRHRAVEGHLRWCRSCGRMARNLSRTVDALHRLRRGDAPEARSDPGMV